MQTSRCHAQAQTSLCLLVGDEVCDWLQPLDVIKTTLKYVIGSLLTKAFIFLSAAGSTHICDRISSHVVTEGICKSQTSTDLIYI